MDFFTALIFVIVVIASMAQKFQEAKKENAARLSQKNKSKPSEVSPAARKRMMEGTAATRAVQSKAREVVERVKQADVTSETTGRELIEALFGEGATDTDDGWEEVHPVHREVKKRKVQHVERDEGPAHAREAALKQREQMEHHRSREHRTHGTHKGRKPTRAEQNEQKRRQQVMAERQRRKEQAEAQRRKASQARQKRQKRKPAIVAPVARGGGFVPGNLGEVRRAIVMAEILGQPKAFE